MDRAVPYEQLARVDRAVICGLLRERGEPARTATHEFRWQRSKARWEAVFGAFADAAAAVQPLVRTSAVPAWLAPLVRERVEALASTWANGPAAFGVIRTLERLGLVEFAPDHTYVLAAVGGLGEGVDGGRVAAIRDDPDLVERVIWRMFEVEGGGQVSLANIDRFSAAGRTWQADFLALVADGTLPRERVLEACLAALNRDFSAYRAGWFARLYLALQPTVTEQASHQPALRALLRSDIDATVTLAVKRLRAVGRAGLLDDSATAPALSAAVLVKAKGTAIEAVRLLDDIVKRQPALPVEVVAVASTALEHPHADVQRAAATLLVRLGAQDAVTAVIESLSPSVRAGLAGAISLPVSGPVAAGRVSAPLPSADRVAASRHDLLDRLAALLEDAGDALEVELVMAGLARLGEGALLRPLCRRATTVLQRGPQERVTPGWLRGQLARLVLRASGEQVAALPVAVGGADFLVQRLEEVTDIVLGRQPVRALLATPEQAGGWISPDALLHRLQTAGHWPLHHDLVAALLRLHPADRAGALTKAAGAAALRGEVAEVVRYALGVAPEPDRRRVLKRTARRATPAWWVAASRARMPFEVDEWLMAHGISGTGRSHPIEGCLSFRANPYTWKDSRGRRDGTYWTRSLTLAGPVCTPAPDEPTAVCCDSERKDGNQEDFTRWLALTWPHDAEHFLVAGSGVVVDAATDSEVHHDSVRVLAALADHPGRLGRLALTTLAAGLSAGKPDQRVVAADAVLQLHGAGRLSAAQLAEGLAAFRGPGSVTRWAGSLGAVASADAVARSFVVDVLSEALPCFDRRARGLHALLELLLEELLRAGRPTPSVLRSWLAGFAGGSRTSKAAAALFGN